MKATWLWRGECWPADLARVIREFGAERRRTSLLAGSVGKLKSKLVCTLLLFYLDVNVCFSASHFNFCFAILHLVFKHSLINCGVAFIYISPLDFVWKNWAHLNQPAFFVIFCFWITQGAKKPQVREPGDGSGLQQSPNQGRMDRHQISINLRDNWHWTKSGWDGDACPFSTVFSSRKSVLTSVMNTAWSTSWKHVGSSH